ncbi:MAG TPA: ABC transporter ATP-binding protein [Anaerolineae bacterium]|nr:ABC transporter ATP-binding protein [Anaerolineae bacterium]HQH37241.1 ABC transporter ATP-binding protein [Anaerolineae bacterium]
MAEPLVEIKDLHVEFEVRDGIIRGVDGFTLTINRGETLGVIGESGCGKSITAKAVMQMVPKPGKITGGEIIYYRRDKYNPHKPTEVVNITNLDPDGDTIRTIRGGEFAMIFQEPMSSLTPVYTTGTHIGEALKLHRLIPKTVGEQMTQQMMQYRPVTKQEAREISIEMLQKVGIPKPHERVDAYPHQLSGGQRQRVMIAIALSCQPFMLIADEPTTALDVSIEAQILDLMRELQDTMEMSIMFITHNLGVVAEMAKEIVVMYMGKQVEKSDTVRVFYDPKHPYTRALLQSIPKVGKRTGERLASIKGMVPDPFHLPNGCVFHPRCPSFVPGKCDVLTPNWIEIEPNHWVRCLLYEGV